MSQALAAVYLPIIPDASKIAPGVKQALGAVERQGDASGRTLGSRISGAMGKAMRTSALATGAAVGGILGSAVTKGFGRLTAIDSAEAKLTGLGHSATGVSTIMSDALAAVKGTAFGMGDAASAAASAVAAGVKPGQDLQRTLTLMGDAAAIAGTDLGEMASIFNKVATSGKIQGDVIAQLGDRGIPIISLLADELGIASDEVYKLASQGEIDFATFQNAIETGMGGAALEAGNTFVGAMDNAGAALGRLGAAGLEPFFEDMKSGIRAFTEHIDSLTDRVGPAAEALRGKLGPAAQQAGLWIQSTVVPGLEKLGNHAAAAAPTLINVATALGNAAGPAFRVAESLGAASAALGVSSWHLLLTALDATAAVLNAAVVPALNVVADLAEENEWAVIALVAAWAAFKTVPGIVDKVKNSLSGLGTASQGIADMRAYAKSTGEEMTRMEAAIAYAGTSSNTVLAQAGRSASQAEGGFARFNAAAVGAARGGLTQMKNSLVNVVNAMGGPLVVGIGAVIALLASEKAAAQEAKAANEKLAEAVRDGERAQVDFAAAVAGTSGELSEQGLAAAARVAAGELAHFTTEGERSIGPVERMAHAMSGVDAVLERIPGMYTEAGKAINAQNREVKASREAYSALEDAMYDLQLPMSSLGEIVAEGGEDYRQLVANLRESGDAGVAAAEQLEQARDKVAELEAEARNMSPAAAEMAAAVRDIADSAGDAESEVIGLWEAVLEMRGVSMSATDASAKLTRELDGVAESIRNAVEGSGEFEGAMLGVNGAFDATTTAGANAHGAMSDMAQAMLQSVASGNDARAVWEQSWPVLREFGEAAGLTEEQIRAMARAYDMTPDRLEFYAEVHTDDALAGLQEFQSLIETRGTTLINTEVALTGGDAVYERLLELGVEIEKVDGKEGRFTVTAVDDDARRNLAEVLGLIETIPPANIDVNADTAAANEAISHTGESLINLSEMSATPTVAADTTPFNIERDNAHLSLDFLGDRWVEPGAGLNAAVLQGNVADSHGRIDLLDADYAEPDAGLNAADLQLGVTDSHGRIDILDADTAVPTAMLDNSGVRRGVDDSRSWLSGLIREFGNFSLNVGLNVVRNIRDVFTGGGNADGGTIPGLAAGGTALDLTRGGRLPTSGPGTGIVDGFLAVDRAGMPLVRVDAGEEVVNARASAKHRDLIKAINRDDPAVAEIPGFNTGGTIGSREAIERVLAEAKSSHDAGATYVWGGHSRTGADCSGYVGRLGWTAMGRNPDSAGRMGTTHTLMAGQWPGFVRGRQGPFVIGVNNVHMAATVDGHPAESGGDVGGPSLGRGDGAWDPQFTEHWYLPHHLFSPPHSDAPVERTETIYYGSDGTTTSRPPQGEGGDARHVELSPEASRAAEKTASQDPDHPLFGTGADSWSDLGGNIAKSAAKGQIASLLKVLGIPDELPPLVKAGRKWYQQVEDEATTAEVNASDDAIVEAAEAEPADADYVDAMPATEAVAPAAPVDDGTPQAAGRRAVAPRGWDTGAQWDALDYIYQRESEWNPHATNPSSGAFGIPQFNPVSGTLQQYLPDRSTDPFRQVTAGAQYIEDRYGDPLAARRFWEANNWYDRGGVARGKGHMLKNTLEPERVLSPEQTRAFEKLVFEQLDDLAGLAESVVSSGVAGAVGAGAGMADMVMPGAGAMISPLGGPAGDLAGWYAGEVTDNLVTTGKTFAQDITGILGSQLQAMSPVTLPTPERVAPIPASPPLGLAESAPRRGYVAGRTTGGNGDVHFHVADNHHAVTYARRIAADEARGLIGV